MSDALLDRRSLLGAASLIGAAAATTGAVAQGRPPVNGGATYAPTAKPLPFNPATISGLSEKLLVSHHANNYGGAVKRIGAITGQFAALDPATAPGFLVNGLKREELIAWNSMILHEAYFAGLGAPSQPNAALARQMEHDFGSVDRWRAEFSGMGKALAGGSGWVILQWSYRDNRLVNQWAADHTMTLAGSTPVLVLDMYEHAYALDYGAKAAAYVDAFMKTIAWSNADGVFARTAA